LTKEIFTPKGLGELPQPASAGRWATIPLPSGKQTAGPLGSSASPKPPNKNKKFNDPD